ncbi:TP0183 family DNA metabolism protein [Leadbettera azotonutricia]|uniref:Uncharacterized protein n=1 Tax=Leadbettera azotonutricia (strain ATCC BAA-888 / DSM 13862 / ZAS-9) TaxID=545695 RepID=F5YCW1_LEAAZ|nr:hypothetical protein [Leadbettera azotonutricia]AEF80748.1 hypothetical protein TREAZ_0413 [Leadbettera azotonutricia ZAS-9]
MRKRLLPFLAAVFFPFLAYSQESKPIIRFSPFFTKGIGIEETRFIESLIQSYLSDFGDVVNFFDSSLPQDFSGTGALPDTWTKAPDYVLTGSIYLEPDGRIFTLEVHNTVSGDTLSSTTVHRTASDLALKARSLVENVFSSPVMAAKASPEAKEAPAERPEPITETAVIGTWRGESGIEMIRLQQGGRGVAFFSSGAQMNLSYTIENNTLKVRQNSPNTERYYYPLPYGVAKQLSAEAGPMVWELYLYSGGAHLKGVKISAEAKVEGNLLVEINPEASRDTKWTRSMR